MKILDSNSVKLLANPSTNASSLLAKRSLSYNLISMTSGMLIVSDIISLLFAAASSVILYDYWQDTLEITRFYRIGFCQAALVAIMLAPLILYNKGFGAVVARGRISFLILSHILRFMLFASVVLIIGVICQMLDNFPQHWLVVWFTVSLLLTLLTRLFMAMFARSLQRRGMLTEVIAVVGSGPIADRLIQILRHTHPDNIEFLGIFDDKIIGAKQSLNKSSGNLMQLLELGKTHKIDWILLTLPAAAEQRVQSLVQRLKALAVPIGLCPEHVGSTVPYRSIGYIGDDIPMSMLADCPKKKWHMIINWGENLLPRWIVTVGLLPLLAIQVLLSKLFPSFSRTASRKSPAKLTFHFDNYDLASFTNVAASFGQQHYGYAVTPNADHLIRLHDDSSFRELYAAASYILLDSRFLSHVIRITKNIYLPVSTGSDLTSKLFAEIISPDDPIVLIGSSDDQARQLGERYGLNKLAHYNPPMGFIRDYEQVDKCLRFIEANSPFRFCLLAIGAPQQEAVARQLKMRGIARGLALCIGASIDFITGKEHRAPLWIQRYGAEWLFRLLQSPWRLSKRYLVRGPRVFKLLYSAEIILRKI